MTHQKLHQEQPQAQILLLLSFRPPQEVMIIHQRITAQNLGFRSVPHFVFPLQKSKSPTFLLFFLNKLIDFFSLSRPFCKWDVEEDITEVVEDGAVGDGAVEVEEFTTTHLLVQTETTMTRKALVSK